MSEDAIPPQVPSAAQALQDAPGYKAAKICGILSICFAITCVGFPIAIILGIVALVKQGTAKRLARERPEAYRMPPSGAFIMGIIGLILAGLVVPTLGIGAAVAIPTFIKAHNQARVQVLLQNIQIVKNQSDQIILETGTSSPDQLAQALLSDPSLSQLKNPFDSTAPALEMAQTPSKDGTIALWPATEEGPNGETHARLLLVANYTENHEVKQLNEEIVVSVFGAPETPVPEETFQEPPAP